MKNANSNAITVSVLSPPDNTARLCGFLSGGSTSISIPELKISSLFVKINFAFPPPNKRLKISLKYTFYFIKSQTKLCRHCFINLLNDFC